MDSERSSCSNMTNNNSNSSTRLVEAVVDKMEQEVMLPGFRFHPTDEELVGFYLKRKINQRPLSIELIKQLDIYKFDPWDLPKMATTGEKEWYFFCPRDRKYRNSARPNRVTGAGFWKATGTDRPIYSSEGNKCIGLKKSLVFYKGRAAKGFKTDWMMHEFRLPSLSDHHHSTPPPPPPVVSKRFLDKTIPANDAWAICRIFKKTNSTAQRTHSQSWVSPLVQEVAFTSEVDHHMVNMSTTSTSGSIPPTPPIHHFNYNNNITIDHQTHHYSSPTYSYNHYTNNLLSPIDHFGLLKPIINNNIPLAPKPSYQHLQNYYPSFNTLGDHHEPSAKSTLDLSSMLLNMSSASSVLLDDYKQQGGEGGDHESVSSVDQFSSGSQQSNENGGGGGGGLISSLMNGPQGIIGNSELADDHGDHHNVPSMMMKSSSFTNMDGIPFSCLGDGASAWKQNLLLWDYANSSSPCPSNDQVPSTFSTTKCYT